MTLAELQFELRFMCEEVESLIEHFGEEAVCEEIEEVSIDSLMLLSEFKNTPETEICNLPGIIENACQNLEDLIEEYNGEALCGDFEIR